MSDPIFPGFPPEIIDFFLDLEENNNREWFSEHKDDYETFVLEPSREFVIALGERLKDISSELIADPRVDKSIFRIYRDVRFSKDKTPYKTNLAVWMWEGGERMESSGYYLHFEPSHIYIGVGIYIFPRNILEEFRKSVVHPDYGPELASIIEGIKRSGPYKLYGKHYKRMPTGYDKDHDNAELLLYNGLHMGLEPDVPDEFFTPEILDYCYERFEDLTPLHRWLVAMTGRV